MSDHSELDLASIRTRSPTGTTRGIVRPIAPQALTQDLRAFTVKRIELQADALPIGFPGRLNSRPHNGRLEARRRQENDDRAR
jgi:hypothetical protein